MAVSHNVHNVPKTADILPATAQPQVHLYHTGAAAGVRRDGDETNA